jgi:hypothetical protein
VTTMATAAAVAGIRPPPVSARACLSQGRVAPHGCQPTEMGASAAVGAAAAAAAAASVAAVVAVVPPAPAPLIAAPAAAGGTQWQLLARAAAGDTAVLGGDEWCQADVEQVARLCLQRVASGSPNSHATLTMAYVG